ncbi:MAG: hypothetical protein WC389_15650 [Lutibacter sp.]|jgi:hypothetical protein
MKIKELIDKYDQEIENIVKESKKDESPSTNDVMFRTSLIFQFRRFVNDLKQLNETPVKRSELIDFFDYIIKRYSSDERFHRETVVDDYLKSINAAKRIES